MEARKQLLEYRKYYRNYLSGYQDEEMVVSAPELGIRESRRIKGDYTLVLDDFKNQAIFKDEIGRYCYNIDIHASVPGTQAYQRFEKDHTTYRYKTGESYGIPYRCLCVASIKNLLMAAGASVQIVICSPPSELCHAALLQDKQQELPLRYMLMRRLQYIL